MHQRKSEMAKHADAFIALPGIHLVYQIIYISTFFCFSFFSPSLLVEVFHLFFMRWIRNNGRIVRDDNLVSVRNPRETSKKRMNEYSYKLGMILIQLSQNYIL